MGSAKSRHTKAGSPWPASCAMFVVHVLLIISAVCASPSTFPAHHEFVFDSSEPASSQLIEALHNLQMLPNPAYCYGFRKAVRTHSGPSEEDIVFALYISRRSDDLTNCSMDTMPFTSSPSVEESSINREVTATNTANRVANSNLQDDDVPPSFPIGQVSRDSLMETETDKKTGKLSRTQLTVISTCSVVIGLFFIAALAMRLRNYLKRRRRPAMDRWGSARSSNSGKHHPGGLGQPGARQKSPLASSQVDQQSLEGPVFDRGGVPTLNNWGGNHLPINDVMDEKPMLVITSASVPSSPSLPTMPLDYGLPQPKVLTEDVTRMAPDDTHDHNANTYLHDTQQSERTSASSDDKECDEDEDDNCALWESGVAQTSLAGFTQSDLSIASTDVHRGYCYGNQEEYTCTDWPTEPPHEEEEEEEEEEECIEEEEKKTDEKEEEEEEQRLVAENVSPVSEIPKTAVTDDSPLLGPDFEGMTPTYV
ncbi:hypothetical protein CAPTEDRAFT_202418 [Capitella teleta]|uniref:Uncharacterized protein n=1 Tax=Capitella teleta TaxID=283909 RepID=R7TZ59_CAPTE|nr:hypothetical protein CAPTEDRAFT_202418 [Capitella teleta]|eukprot:ELT99218.1 hypothetical protein CAPTEDRAFT_202418 [Capitella teleta]